MRWHNERITRVLRELYGNGGIQEQTVIPIMRKMRDDYEASMLAHQAQAEKLAQRAMELEAQLAAALATIDRAVGADDSDTGRAYSDGCAP